MKVFGLAGWSGSGKTTLVINLVPALIARGLSVSTMKHTHHNVDLDKPGKDSHEHRLAGAHEVMLAGAKRWALLHENREQPEATMDELLAHMSEVDLVLVEGFKSWPHEKLEVYRPSVGKPLLCADDPSVVAVATDGDIGDVGRPVFALDDVEGIADFICLHLGIGTARAARKTRDGAA